jgi:hypothetical protein
MTIPNHADEWNTPAGRALKAKRGRLRRADPPSQREQINYNNTTGVSRTYCRSAHSCFAMSSPACSRSKRTWHCM